MVVNEPVAKAMTSSCWVTSASKTVKLTVMAATTVAGGTQQARDGTLEVVQLDLDRDRPLVLVAARRDRRADGDVDERGHRAAVHRPARVEVSFVSPHRRDPRRPLLDRSTLMPSSSARFTSDDYSQQRQMTPMEARCPARWGVPVTNGPRRVPSRPGSAEETAASACWGRWTLRNRAGVAGIVATGD